MDLTASAMLPCASRLIHSGGDSHESRPVDAPDGHQAGTPAPLHARTTCRVRGGTREHLNHVRLPTGARLTQEAAEMSGSVT